MTGDPNRGDRTRLSDRDGRTRRDDTHEDRRRRERLERAERRRQERRARAAAAERTRNGGDEAGQDDRSSNSRLLTISLRLRDAAFVLLPIGFIGLTVSDAWLEPTDSPFALVFAAGIVCAIASVYLGIYQHDPTE